MLNGSVLKLVGALVLIALLAFAGFTCYEKGKAGERAVWEQAVQKQKLDAQRELTAATQRAREAEQALDKLKTDVEVRDAQARETIDRTLAENRRLAALAGGVLHDPGRRSSGSCTAAQAPGPASVPADGTAGADLSVEASQFLLDFAAEADRAAQYARSCREWALKVPGVLNAASAPAP